MSTYTVVIHEEPAWGILGRGPRASRVLLAGETVDELLQNLREAIAGVLEVMQEEGRAPESSVQVVELAV